MNIKIYEGDVRFINGTDCLEFHCLDNDVDTAYNFLVKNLALNEVEHDQLILLHLEHEYATQLLETAKDNGFIADYEIE